MSNNTIAEAFGINPDVAAQAPQRIHAEVFFNELAKLGISPASDQEAVEMLEASYALRQKRASFSENRKTLDLLLPKKAAAPAQSQAAPQQSDDIAKTAGMYTDAYLQNDEAVAVLLTNLVG